MDPLSLSASIIAVLQLTSTLASYLNDVRSASKEQRIIAKEASYLSSLLGSLRDRVESAESTNDAWYDRVKSLGLPGGLLEQLQISIEEVIDRSDSTNTVTKRNQLVSSLKWPHNKAKITTLLQRIEHLNTLIQYALDDDLFSLTKAIHDQSTNLLSLTKAIHDQGTDLASSTKAIYDQGSNLAAQIADLDSNANEQHLRDKISGWLNAAEPSLNYNAALYKRHSGTGSWLLKHHTFLEWKNQKPSTVLCLYGNAGCGKTILCSTLLEHILKISAETTETTLVCYFFFDFKDTTKQHTSDFLRSLARQVMNQVKDLSTLKQAYSIDYKDGELQPTEDKLRSLIQAYVASSHRTYIILDALDECSQTDGLLLLLKEIETWPRTSIITTTRRKKDIENYILNADYKINIETSLVDDDIKAYTRHRVENDSRLKKWSFEHREEIISTVTTKSEGMFIWVFCQLEALSKCIKLTGLRKTLASLPKTLDETYTRIIDDIKDAGHIEEAKTALQWLCFSMRPLKISEMVEILAIQPGVNGSFDPDERLLDPEDIKTICSSLVVPWDLPNPDDSLDADVDSSGLLSTTDPPAVRLFHFSVREYLVSDRCVLQPLLMDSNCHADISQSCLRYLKYVTGLGKLDEKLAKQFPLINYAAQFWHQHLRKLEDVPDHVLHLAFELFKNEAFLLAWTRLCGHFFFWPDFDLSDEARYNFSLTESSLRHPLAYAAFTRLPGLVRMVLDDDDINLEDQDLNSAFHQAVKSGSAVIVQMILDAGADINALPEPYSMLRVKSIHEWLQSLKALGKPFPDDYSAYVTIEHGALDLAVNHGYEDITQLLLSRGINHKQRIEALRCAVEHPNLLKMILEAGVDVNVELANNWIGIALDIAVRFEKVTSLQMLIRWATGANALSGQLTQATATALEKGAANMFRMLLEAGASYYDGSIQLGDALHLSIRRGHTALAMMFLNHLLDNKGESQLYSSALVEAALHKNQTIVEHLLSLGADPEFSYGTYNDALQASVIDGKPFVQAYRNKFELQIILVHYQFVMRLIIKRAQKSQPLYSNDLFGLQFQHRFDLNDVWVLFDDRGIGKRYIHDYAPEMRVLDDLVNALQSLCQAQDSDGLRYKLQNLRIRDIEYNDGENLLQILLDLSEPLIQEQQISMQKSYLNRSKLTHASKKLVRILIEAGSNVNSVGGYYGTALQAASRNGRQDIVSLLLQHGALVNGNEGIFGNPLQAACAAFKDNIILVEALLDAGANVNALGGLFGTALQAACYRGFTYIVSLLLRRGADVNIQAGRYGNALQAACASPACTAKLVRSLLDAGADPHAEGGIFGSAVGALRFKEYRLVLVPPEKEPSGKAHPRAIRENTQGLESG